MAKISGNLSAGARIIVVNESNWTVESNTTKSAGNFEITDLADGDKTIISRASTGECVGYGNVTAIYEEPPNPWQSVWDNTKWEASSGSWNGSAWVSENSGWSQWLTLGVKSGETWNEGYRPTKVRVTLSPTGSTYIFSGWDTYFSARWDTTTYTNLVELNITWGSQDLVQINLEISGGAAPQFTVSNIEWYV
jgi:hypothetical protein